MADVLLGQTGLGANSANSNGGQTAFAARFQCLATGTINSVWVRCGTNIPSAANTHWAIYADSAGPVPGTRLTADNSGTAGTANTYSSFPISPGLDVTIGTWYWIAFLSAGAGVVFDYTDNVAHPDGGNSEDSAGLQTTLATPYNSGAAFTNIVNMRAEGVAVSAIYSIPSFIAPGLSGPKNILQFIARPWPLSAPDFVQTNVTVDMTGIVAIANASAMATFQEAARAIAPPAIAAASGIVPIPRVIVKPPPGVANASGITQTKVIVRTAGTPFALATGVALPANPPAPDVVVHPPPSVANASGITPAKLIVKVFPPAAIATGSGILPIPFANVQIAPPAIANASAVVPTLKESLSVNAVRATAPATANSPTKIIVRVQAPVAIANARAMPPFDPSSSGTFPDQIRKKFIKEQKYPTIP